MAPPVKVAARVPLHAALRSRLGAASLAVSAEWLFRRFFVRQGPSNIHVLPSRNFSRRNFHGRR